MFCVSLGVVFVFVGFLVALHGDSSMDYVSIQPKSPFDAHCRHDDVATALIRGICKMQLAVRIVERPGGSHEGVGRKKMSKRSVQLACSLVTIFYCSWTYKLL